MYQSKIEVGELEEGVLVLRSTNRNYHRNLELLCNENNFRCVTTVEVAPRVVTFKNLTPTPAEAAKADAKADIKAASKGK